MNILVYRNNISSVLLWDDRIVRYDAGYWQSMLESFQDTLLTESIYSPAQINEWIDINEPDPSYTGERKEHILNQTRLMLTVAQIMSGEGRPATRKELNNCSDEVITAAINQLETAYRGTEMANVYPCSRM